MLYMLNDHLEEFPSKMTYRQKFNCSVADSSEHMMRDKKFLSSNSNGAKEAFCHVTILLP